MTTKEIQALIGKEQVLKNHNPVCENVKYLFSDWEHDVISVSKSGYIYEFEVKISRSDFLADRKKKRKIQFYSLRVERHSPNYLTYVCPEGLISVDEVPEYAGLSYVINGELVNQKPAPLLHKFKMDKLRLFEKMMRLMSERHFFGGALMTIRNKEIAEQAKAA